jgi:cold shock CspA family protein
MQVPIQVTFRHLQPSSFIASAVKKRANRLEKFFPRITSLRIMIEPLQRRKTQGNLYHVRIDMAVPGRELVVQRNPGRNHAHEDIYVAIRDAFDSARRQLEDFTRRNYQLKVKTHEPAAEAKVVRLFPNEGCGFLKTSDGREIYFHQNSVTHHSFDRIHLGDRVRFVESMGEKGPQASTVIPVG